MAQPGFYTINFTDPAKGSFVIEPYTTDGPISPNDGTIADTSAIASTTLLLYGKGQPGYGERTAENLVHLLENFASATAPVYPTIGQLWYDSGNEQLKIWTLVGGTGPSWAIVFDSNGEVAAGDLDMANYNIINLADPSNPGDALNLGYGDTRYLNATGDTLAGALIVPATTTITVQSGATITIADAPTASTHAVNKSYVDTADSAIQTSVNTKVSKSGDTMTGFLTLFGDPANPLHASTKQYTDLKVAKSGDTMTGSLILAADPVLPLEAATKQYVDLHVEKAGDAMTGFLTLNSDPTDPLHASTKQYTDTMVSKAGDVMTGLLELSGDPASALHAATKQYADTKLDKSGDTMTGSLILAADPVLPLEAATKQYVDATGADGVVTGGSVSGNDLTLTRSNSLSDIVINGIAPAVHTHSAVEVTFAPTGNIAATTVQLAIEELDLEKAPTDTATFTGITTTDSIVMTGGNNLTLGADPVGDFDAATKQYVDNAVNLQASYEGLSNQSVIPSIELRPEQSGIWFADIAQPAPIDTTLLLVSTNSAPGETTEHFKVLDHHAAFGNGVKVGNSSISGDVAGYQVFYFNTGKTGTDSTGLIGDAGGYQTANYSVVLTGADPTGLANDATVYTMGVVVDSGASQPVSVVGSAAQTWTTLLAEINADLTGAIASIDSDGTLRITSSTTGPTSTVEITDTDLLASTTNFVDLDFDVPGTTTVTYTISVQVDGGSTHLISIDGNDAQTFTDLLSELNIQLAADSGYQVLEYSVPLVGTDPTGLANDATVYTSSVIVDGGASQPISVVGSAAQTWTTLLAEINADITGAVASIDGDGFFRITSDSTGSTSTIDINDTDLLATTTNVLLLQTAVDGTVAATATLDSDGNIKITSSTTGPTSHVQITADTLLGSITNAQAYLRPVYGYEAAGTIRWTGTEFQGFNGTIWDSLAGGIDGVSDVDTLIIGSAASSDDETNTTIIGPGAFATTSGSGSIGYNTILGTGANVNLSGFAEGRFHTVLGHNASVAHGNNDGTGRGTVIGYNALVNHGGGTAVGATSTAGFNATSLGQNAVASGSNSTALGYNTDATATLSIAIGNSAQALHTDSIAIGSAAVTTAANQLMIGGSNSPITTVYIGEGVARTAPPISLTLNTTGGAGTDVVGTNLIIVAGISTGSAVPGTIEFQQSVPGVSGTTPQTPTTVGAFTTSGDLDLTNGLVVGTFAGADIAGAIRWNGTNFQGYDGITWNNFDEAGGANSLADLSDASADVNSTFLGNTIETSSGYANSVLIGPVTTPSSVVFDHLVSVGTGSQCDGDGATAIGANSFAGTNAVAVGVNSSADAESVAIGRAATAVAGSFAIGWGAEATSFGDLVIGSDAVRVERAYLGRGIASATPGSTIINATSGLGTDIVGGSLVLAPGRGTGTGNSGDVIIQTARKDVTGSTLNSLEDRLIVDEDAIITRDGNFGTSGDAQERKFILRGTTTDATPTELFIGNITNNRITIPVDHAGLFKVRVLAHLGSSTAGYVLEGLIEHLSAGDVTQIVGTVNQTLVGEDVAGWDATVEADDTNNALIVKVTGAAAQNIKWIAVVELIEVIG